MFVHVDVLEVVKEGLYQVWRYRHRIISLVVLDVIVSLQHSEESSMYNEFAI